MTQQQLEQAADLRLAGNALFKSKDFEGAIDKYTAALEKLGDLDCDEAKSVRAAVHSNRALMFLKTEAYGAAEQDASECLKLGNPKGYYRRACASLNMGKFAAARKDFRKVVALYPRDQSAAAQLKACEKLLRQQRVLAALSRDENVQIDWRTIIVEDSYDGPRLRDEKDDFAVDVAFCEHLTRHFRAEKRLHRRYAVALLMRAIDHFRRQSTLLRIAMPEDTAEEEAQFTVVGDTHGQYYDLLNLFEQFGMPSETNPYLFNGDFVDRGSFSVEIALLLLAWKLALPQSVYMLRGNHETSAMNQMYGFAGEVKHKYDSQVMALFKEAFEAMPLAAVVAPAAALHDDSPRVTEKPEVLTGGSDGSGKNGRVFVTHGGVPSGPVTLKDIEDTKRFRQPPENGIMCELLWNDPGMHQGLQASKRGVGHSFGSDVTEAFCERNNLAFVVRSHEVKMAGYQLQHGGRLATVFSAPNYCDQSGNQAAVCRFDAELRPSFLQFCAVPHPPVPPMKYANAGMFGF